MKEVFDLPLTEKGVATAGALLRRVVAARQITCFIGVYDVFSATLASKWYDGLFVSGYGFSASFYGLPDIGYIAWSDMIAFVQRLRGVLPQQHLLVDIDDGYADVDVACHVTRLLESAGASGLVLEDQQRPRRCGHLDGKQIMPLEDFLRKLDRVLTTRNDLYVVARTDSSDPDEISRRAAAFCNAGADAVLVDGLKDLQILRELRSEISVPLMFNQIEGGKSPPVTLNELSESGVSLVNYSTPCLFAAQTAIEQELQRLEQNDGRLPAGRGSNSGLARCQQVLEENRQRSQSSQAPLEIF